MGKKFPNKGMAVHITQRVMGNLITVFSIMTLINLKRGRGQKIPVTNLENLKAMKVK